MAVYRLFFSSGNSVDVTLQATLDQVLAELNNMATRAVKVGTVAYIKDNVEYVEQVQP